MEEQAREVAALFDRDKALIERLLGDVAHLASRGSRQSACKVFAEVRRLIEHHLSAEQRTLDELEREGHRPKTVAAQLLASERVLREATEGVWQTISGSDAREHEPALDGLRAAMSSHWRADRELLFPALCARYSGVTELRRVVHMLVDP